MHVLGVVRCQTMHRYNHVCPKTLQIPFVFIFPQICLKAPNVFVELLKHRQDGHDLRRLRMVCIRRWWCPRGWTPSLEVAQLNLRGQMNTKQIFWVKKVKKEILNHEIKISRPYLRVLQTIVRLAEGRRLVCNLLIKNRHLCFPVRVGNVFRDDVQSKKLITSRNGTDTEKEQQQEQQETRNQSKK